MVAAGTGCATRSGYQQAERSTASMQDTRDMLTKARREVGVTMTALNTMAGQTDGNLVSMFQDYSRSLTALRRSRQRLRSQVQTMRSRSEGFLEQWQREAAALSSEKARARSDQRRGETLKQYETLVQSMDATRAAVQPLMANLEDIEGMLSQDLSWAGVASVEGLVTKANTQAEEVQGMAAEVMRHLDSMAAALRPPTE
jgi:hypothetical protein